jgi:Na+/H+ antiporter NhaA
MTAFVARVFPKASTRATTEFETFVSVTLFCGVGLLMSLSVLLLDKYIPAVGFDGFAS